MKEKQETQTGLLVVLLIIDFLAHQTCLSDVFFFVINRREIVDSVVIKSQMNPPNH